MHGCGSVTTASSSTPLPPPTPPPAASVSVTVSPNVAFGGSATIAATLTPVPDSNPSTVLSWSLSGAGCSGASCGTLAVATTQLLGGHAMVVSANYTAPLTSPSRNTVTIAVTPEAFSASLRRSGPRYQQPKRRLATAGPRLFWSYDLESVLTHELGHFLRLQPLRDVERDDVPVRSGHRHIRRPTPNRVAARCAARRRRSHRPAYLVSGSDRCDKRGNDYWKDLAGASPYRCRLRPRRLRDFWRARDGRGSGQRCGHRWNDWRLELYCEPAGAFPVLAQPLRVPRAA
jgi:hypothetical protein